MALLKNQAAAGYLLSAMLHAGLMAIVFWRAAPPWVQAVSTPPAVPTTVSDRSIEQTQDAAAWEIDAPDASAADDAETANRTTVDAAPHAASPGLGEFARQRLERARLTAGEKSSEEQLADLESLGRRLSRVSSEKSVEEVAGTLSEWLGTNKRSTQPARAAETSSTFDVGTAQVSDVTQIETDSGTIYVAVLVDAQGNSMETLLDEIDGPQLFKTFQLMKRFPLLETVYRGAVMGLLDKLAQSPSRSDASERPPQTQSDPQQQ